MIEVVAGLILDETGRLLACRRPEGKHLGGKWEFPGGKVEPGEDPAAALVRELEEELGIRVGMGEALTPVIWDYGRGPIRLQPFLCTIVAGEPHPHEHSEIRWCGREDLGGLDWAAADLPILEEWRALLALCPDPGRILAERYRPSSPAPEKVRALVLELIRAHERGIEAGHPRWQGTLDYLRSNVPGVEDGSFFDLPDEKQRGALGWLNAAYFGRGEVANELLIEGYLRPDFPEDYREAVKAFHLTQCEGESPL